MTLKKYTIKVTEENHWQEVYDILCEMSSCEHVPDRKVSCCNEMDHSPTRGTFVLHGYEVEDLKNHPYIEWIELDPSEYPEEYPKPSPYIKRWNKNVKVYRDLDINAPVSTGATVGELDRTGWQIVRSGIKTNSDAWGTSTGNPGVIVSDASYSLTGKNVDIIIQDSGVLQYHPEFMDENGQSRVRDIILDGPYYIDPNYFDNVIPAVKYTKADGRVGIATTSARDWWINSSKRSAGFSTIGTVSVPSDYTVPNCLGTNLTGSNTMISGHGTACASLTAGKNFGLAFQSNIWNMSGIGDPTSITIEQNYDCMKIFHLYKPVNPITGRKNPTLVNGSWGYQAAFSSNNTVTYQFRLGIGTFIGNAAVTDQVTAMKSGLNNQISGAFRSWSSSSRSLSTDEAGKELMDAGVIYIAAAGNNNQRLGVGSTDPDKLNYMSDNWFGTTDPRSHFPSNCVPCNHRDWLNPQGIGFNSTTDAEFHPVICVGAMDEYILLGNEGYGAIYGERKASYSNNGPGIDVWSPADETFAAGTNGVSGYIDYERYDNPIFYDCYFNGTSAASPVACGLVALYLESDPTASSRKVKSWLKKHGSVGVTTLAYADQYIDDTTTTYWTGSFNMRGAERRILYNPFANDTKPTISGIQVSGVSIKI
jgi:hypothetical protein